MTGGAWQVTIDQTSIVKRMPTPKKMYLTSKCAATNEITCSLFVWLEWLVKSKVINDWFVANELVAQWKEQILHDNVAVQVRKGPARIFLVLSGLMGEFLPRN